MSMIRDCFEALNKTYEEAGKAVQRNYTWPTCVKCGEPMPLKSSERTHNGVELMHECGKCGWIKKTYENK